MMNFIVGISLLSGLISFIRVLGEIANGLLAAASGSCIC